MLDWEKASLLRLPPIWVLAGVFLGDRCGHYFLGDLTLAPLLSTLGLAYLALSRRPGIILLWTPLFSVLSFLLLTYWRNWLPLGLDVGFISLPVSFGRGWVRSITVFSVGIICSVLSQQRASLQNSSAEIMAVIRSLPQGVLISDRMGRIVFANQKASKILQIPVEKLVTSSYFSLFARKEGNTAELYGQIAEQPHAEPLSVQLVSRQNPSQEWNAGLFSFRGPSNILLTTLL